MEAAVKEPTPLGVSKQPQVRAVPFSQAIQRIGSRVEIRLRSSSERRAHMDVEGGTSSLNAGVSSVQANSPALDGGL
jgi:hypothetical protein